MTVKFEDDLRFGTTILNNLFLKRIFTLRLTFTNFVKILNNSLVFVNYFSLEVGVYLTI